MSVAREPPYPPPPRQVGDKPDELGRRPSSGPVIRGLRLVAHLAGVALYAGAPVVALVVAYLCLQATDLFVAFRVLGFIVCLTFAIVYIKSLLPRRLPLGPAVISVQPDEQSTTHAFLARVADDVGSPPPRRLLLGSGVELRACGRRSLLDLVFGGTWDVQMGLWLWHGLTLSEFQALIARTLAPLGRGRFDRFRFTTRCLLEALIDGMDPIDELGANSSSAVAILPRIAQAAHRIAVAPQRAIGPLLLRVGIDKEDALLDDLTAVRVAGSDALVHAVLRADFAGATLREMDESLMLAARQGVFTRDLYAHVADAAVILREAHNDFTLGEPPFLRGPHAGKHADVFEPGQRYLSAMWRGLPGPSEREHSAKRTFVPAERDDRPAAELLDEPGRLQEKLTNRRYIEHQGVNEDFLPFPADTVRLWLASKGDDPFPAKYAGCYDGGRRLQPGTRAELDSALAADNWDDARLVSTAAGLYAHAGERASRWRGARQALERLLRRTLYRPSGRERAFAEDLQEDLRKASRWLAALDRWVYIVHVHMSARLTDLGIHDELLHRYESVLRFQTFAADSREYRNRVGGFAHKLAEFSGSPPYRLLRDADREFEASRKDFQALLDEAEAVIDPVLAEWTGRIRLDRFLYAHDHRPRLGDQTVENFGRQILDGWTEVAAKTLWLHRQGTGALVALQDRILNEFTAIVGDQVPPATPPPLPTEIPRAIILEPEPVLEEPEVVDEPQSEPPDDAPDAWDTR